MKVNIGPFPKRSDRKRKIDVRIDHYDVWGLDHTLALIIHPALIELKKQKHGAPYVDDEDVPEELKSTSAPPKKNEWDTDDNHFKRWDWVMEELIWTFAEIKKDDYEEQFFSYYDSPPSKPNTSGSRVDLTDDYFDGFFFDSQYDEMFINYILGDGNPTPEPVPETPKRRELPLFDKEGFKVHEQRLKNGLRLFGKYFQHLWD